MQAESPAAPLVPDVCADPRCGTNAHDSGACPSCEFRARMDDTWRFIRQEAKRHVARARAGETPPSSSSSPRPIPRS